MRARAPAVRTAKRSGRNRRFIRARRRDIEAFAQNCQHADKVVPTYPLRVSSTPRQNPPPETDDARHQAAAAHLRTLFRLHGRLVRTRNREFFELGLSSAAFRILEVIREHPQANMSAIAFHLDLSRQAVHRVARDLVRQEFLTLRRDPRDRRSLIPTITEFGADYFSGAVYCQERVLLEMTSMTRLIDLQFATALARRLWRRVTPGPEARRVQGADRFPGEAGHRDAEHRSAELLVSGSDQE
jgi:DNA-binding MarR family transcriptional regulator